MMIGTSLRARSRRHTSKPSRSGSITSRSTQSAARRSKCVQPGLARRGLVDVVALVPEQQSGLLADARVVLHEQDPSRHPSPSCPGLAREQLAVVVPGDRTVRQGAVPAWDGEGRAIEGERDQADAGLCREGADDLPDRVQLFVASERRDSSVKSTWATPPRSSTSRTIGGSPIAVRSPRSALVGRLGRAL